MTKIGKGLGQLTIARHGVVARVHQHLYADVVGAGFQVGGEADGDGLRGAVEDEGVDEAVAAAVGDVGGAEAVAEQVVDVVAQAKVWVGDEVAADGAGVAGVGTDDDLVLGREQGAGAEDVAGVTGVVGDDEIGMGTRRAVPGQAQGPVTQRGEDSPADGDGGVELVQVGHHRVVR